MAVSVYSFGPTQEKKPAVEQEPIKTVYPRRLWPYLEEILKDEYQRLNIQNKKKK